MKVRVRNVLVPRVVFCNSWDVCTMYVYGTGVIESLDVGSCLSPSEYSIPHKLIYES